MALLSNHYLPNAMKPSSIWRLISVRIFPTGAVPHALLDSCQRPTNNLGTVNGPSWKVSIIVISLLELITITPLSGQRGFCWFYLVFWVRFLKESCAGAEISLSELWAGGADEFVFFLVSEMQPFNLMCRISSTDLTTWWGVLINIWVLETGSSGFYSLLFKRPNNRAMTRSQPPLGLTKIDIRVCACIILN